MAGVDLTTVKEHLGHKDIKMTLRYAHLAPAHKGKAVNMHDTHEEGVQLLELAQRAVNLYKKQNMIEKRELLNFVYSNSTWKNGQLFPN